MSDSKKMRLGRFGKSGSVDLSKIKAGLTAEEAKKISSEVYNIFEKYDTTDDDVLDANEVSVLLEDVRKAAKHGKNDIFSKREAKKLLKRNNIQDSKSTAYFDMLKGMEGRSETTPQQEENEGNQTVQEPEQENEQQVQQPSTEPEQPAEKPVSEDEQPKTGGTTQSKHKNLITYAKAGETFDDTANRLGFQKGSKEYNEFLKANREAAQRKWFMVGEEVIIPDSIKGKLADGAILSKKEGNREVKKWQKSNSAKKSHNTPHVSTPATPKDSQPKTKSNGGTNPTKPDTPVTPTDPTNPVQKPDNKDDNNEDNKPVKKPETDLQGDLKLEIAWLKNHHGKYTLTGDANSGYTLDITEGDNLTSNKAYNIVYRYDKNGKTIGKDIKYNNGQISSYNRGQDGKMTGKITQKAANTKTQNIQANLQKAYNGKAHLEFDRESKKWVSVLSPKDRTFNGVKVNEVRVTLNNSCWQSRYDLSNDSVVEQLAESRMTSTEKQATNADEVKESYINHIKNPQEDDYFNSIQISYENGRVTKTTYKDGRPNEVMTIHEGTPKTSLHTPTQLVAKIPDDAPETAKKFTNKLVDMKTKTSLMQDLGIDSDTYNMLAQTAVSIGNQEMNGDEDTRWGEKPSNRLKAKQMLQEADTNGNGIIDGDESSIIELKVGKGHHISYGVTQIKYYSFVHSSDPEESKFYQNMFKKYGINSAKDLNDPQKSAAATMIILSRLNKQVNSSKVQQAMEACQGRPAQIKGYTYNETTHSLDATGDDSSQTYITEVTQQDALALLWNRGNLNSIMEKRFDPATQYVNHVRRFNELYNIQEVPESRTAAEAKEVEIRKQQQLEKEQKTPFQNPSNNGDQGSVVFMPAMYHDKSKHLNTKDEIQKLTDTLKQKGIDENYITQLTTAMKNGEVSFDFGLRQSEMDSMTNGDIKLLLEHLNKLKTKLNSDTNINTSDGISSAEAKQLMEKYSQEIFKAESEYRKQYLTNHAQTYNIATIRKYVISEFAVGVSEPEYFDKKQNRRGFHHVKSKGVNTRTTRGTISQQQNILATAADNYVKQTNPNNNNAGYCLTGVKAAMRAAGIDVSDMVKYGSIPKNAKNWFDAHKKMFTQVAYIDTGNNRGRDIVESDIRNLPAGYFVIFIPENSNGYESQDGHIAITNGYGQGLSDSSDNMGWADYATSKQGNGKGEHGKFYVYKLSDNWTVGADNKLKLKSSK